MARPRAARLATAYDLGHEHGRTGFRPRNADDVIGEDPDMQQAYDDGLVAGTDSLDDHQPRAPHRASGRAPTRPRTTRRAPSAGPSSEDRLRAEADAHTERERRRQSQRFSHPLHWGSGARGHVVGKPTLTPPRRLSASDGTGFLFGVFLYAMGINYLRYGPQGMTSWLSAKFINKPTLTTATNTTTRVQPDPNLLQLLNPLPAKAPVVAPPASSQQQLIGQLLNPTPAGQP